MLSFVAGIVNVCGVMALKVLTDYLYIGNKAIICIGCY